MSRDTSQVAADRRLWLAERCPSCGAAAGARCRERSSARRAPPPRLALHAARGWRQRVCPACKARPGEPCLTPRGRIKPAPHAVRLSAARGELRSLEEVWRALERLGASGAPGALLGRRRPPRNPREPQHRRRRSGTRSVGGRERARRRARRARYGRGRYGSFRTQPPIRAALAWNVVERSLVLAGTRGGERFEQTLHHAAAQPPRSATARHVARRVPRDACGRTGERHTPGVRALRSADHPRPATAASIRVRSQNRLRWHLLELCPELEAKLKRGSLSDLRQLERLDGSF